MNLLICPDKFAGTLSASEAAAAMARGWVSVHPDDDLHVVPLADGGPGFVRILHHALGGTLHSQRVLDPLGRSVTAEWLEVDGTAYIESAAACGLALMTYRDPMRASTYGVGQLVAAASHLRRIVVGLGGSGTNDGGAGAIEALTGVDLPELVLACDVQAPLLGPNGATYGFARQKGATDAQLPVLEERMRQWAQQDLGLAGTAGAGAAGGLGFGLMLLGGRQVNGVDLVLQAVGLPELCADADLVITGEGRLDEQSLRGKVISGVLRNSRKVVIIAGESSLVNPPCEVFTLVAEVGAQRAFDQPAEALAEVTAHVARRPNHR